MRLLLLAALLGAASAARAGVGRAVELALPEANSFKPVTAPAISLQLPAASLVPVLAPSLVAAPLAPALLIPAAPSLAPLKVEAARPVDALRATGQALTKSAPASAEASSKLAGLYDGGVAPKAAAAEVSAGLEVSARAPALAPSTPRRAKAMPEGVKRAFQNSAVLGGGMAALGGGLFAWTQNLPSAPTPAQFALLAAPMLLIPLHFALVSSFWASRYYGYPRLSAQGKSAFESAWRAISLAYPAAALMGMAAWFQLVGNNSTMLLLMGLPALVALGEVTHHFLYRVVPERAQDKGKPLTDWRSRVGGNIGQQLARMRRKGA